MRVRVTKAFDFCYGHHLPEYEGKCCRFHGHNARLEVTVCQIGDIIEGYPGMVVDFNDMKAHIEPILATLDHQDLNNVLPKHFQPPTCENLAWYLFTIINQSLPPGIRIEKVRLTETPTSWAEVLA